VNLIRKLFFLLVLIFSLISCSEDQNDNQQLTAKTNKPNYVNGEIIGFTLNNYNSTTAHLASCCTSVAFYIDINENGNWSEHSNFGLPCLALCPGIDLQINYLETIVDSFTLAETGKFRIRIPYTFNQDQNWNSEIISNTFIIE
jgi:hypothetical protein